MPRSAGGDAEATPGGAEASPGLPDLWTGRSILAGAGALFTGTVLGFEIAGFAELAVQAPAPPDGPAKALLVSPFLVCFGGPFALLASLLVVLPTASTARWASGRFTGRDVWWWVPVVAVVPVTAGAAAFGITRRPGPGLLTLSWPAAAVLLTGAALLARDAALHGGRLRRTLGRGALAAVVVFGIGAAVFATGLVAEYRPPKVDAAQLVGNWTDGQGGTLRLAADGTARADTLTDHDSAVEHGAALEAGKHPCSGRGTWSYEPGDTTTWGQSVRLDIEGCSFSGDSDGWRISGTPDRPELNREYGDPDSPDWYTLSR
ncbi:hypothetical protein [Streptomyces sp. NBC_01217]|uniref:hypothetical protein n=1 Tax=Streptomyces sp. NBC_01217 TaxID=2903779 RepID=UPI002E0D56EB|nr:hypothetical protein OG507_23635 [Streptomyces sp. NBC_01217]